MKLYLVNFCKINNILYKVDIYLYYGLDVLVVLYVGVDIRYGLFGVGIELFYVMEWIYIDFIKVIEKLLYVYCLLLIE